jgi:hypothetical protein
MASLWCRDNLSTGSNFIFTVTTGLIVRVKTPQHNEESRAQESVVNIQYYEPENPRLYRTIQQR